MEPLTEALQIILPLVHVLLFFTCFGWAVGIRTRCRELIAQRLAQIRTKRAIKEALRAPEPDNCFPAKCITWLRICRLRRLGGDDRIIRFWGRITDAALLLFPAAEGICALGSHIPVCAWIAAGIVVSELLFALILGICCIRKPAPRKRSPYEKRLPAAYWLRYGYLLAAGAALCFGLPLLTAGMLYANALHLLAARHFHADHFYCMMQNLHRQPMTPHRHSEKFKAAAHREAALLIILSLILGSGAFLYAILQP